MRAYAFSFLVGGVALACGPEPKAPARPHSATLYFSTIELAPGRTFPSPLVRGMVNGKDTAFIVDTGAQVSVVDATLAADASLAVQAGGAAQDPSGTKVPMSKTVAPSFVITGLGAIPDAMTAVIALPEIFTKIGVGAILSPQSLARGGHQVVLDMEHNELRLDDAGAASQISDRVFDLGPIQVCRYDDHGFGVASLITQATIDGVVVPVEIDTGASTTFVVADSAIGRKLAERTDGEKKSAVSAAGELETARYDQIAAKIGEVDASGPLMTMPGKRVGVCGYEGRIGIDRLRKCTLVISERDARGTCGK